MSEIIRDPIVTKQRYEKGDVEVLETERGGYEVRVSQLPLDFYKSRNLLGNDRDVAKRRYDSGIRFYSDFYISGQFPGMTVDYDKVYSVFKKQFLPATQKQREALDRWRAAYASVHGDVGKMLAVNVCCYGFNPYDRDWETL